MSSSLYIAVDLGAGSGRVFLAGFTSGEVLLEETRRFHYPPRAEGGRLRWNFDLILGEIKAGLISASARARDLGRPVESIGVDSWAVDYGLLDSNGKIVADPVCYRDSRTNGVMERVFEKVPRREIFEKTGIQFLQFNTLFQLYADHDEKRKAEKLLLLPDLINYCLTGRAVAEYTNATTTQMVNASTGNWDGELIGRLGISERLLSPIVPAGTDLGPLQDEIAEEVRLPGVHVIAPATHDTGSAVAATPLDENTAYISSGTWSLIGVERPQPLINDDVARHNFTNEGGAFGTIRFLKNVMGLWIFESCRKEWKSGGIDVEYDVILGEIESIEGFPGFLYPDDETFLNPVSILDAIADQLKQTGQDSVERPAVIAKIVFDSLAFRYASVLKSIESLTETKLKNIQILGGGGRNRYLNQMTSNITGLPVMAGLIEATVLGNALVQAVASGRFETLSAGRQHIRENVRFDEYRPRKLSQIADARARYSEIESFFTAKRFKK